MVSPYLMDVVILLIAAVIVVPLSQWFKLGAVPGFLIAGVIVGPSGFGLIENISEIGHLAEIGVVLLLFIIGIELKPSRLWLMRRLVFGLGMLQVVCVGLLLGAASYFLFGISVQVSVLIGLALALSSTAFVIQLLIEQKALMSVYGRTAFAILLFQDLAVVPLLALLPLLASPQLSIGGDIGLALVESFVIIVLVILFGRFLLNPMLHRVALSRNSEIFTTLAVLIVLGAALLTEHAGLSMAMGAFLAGLLISDSSYRHEIISEIQPFRGLLLGLFFMSMGMSINLNLLFEKPLLSFGLVGALILIKAAALYPIARLFGIGNKVSIAVSLVLAQSGEFALVIFSLAFQVDFLTEALFQQLLLIVLISMLVTPLLAYWAKSLARDHSVKKQKHDEPLIEAPIVLAGFGRVGHSIGEILSLAGKPFVALDSDALLVEKERAAGHPIFYGDVRKAGLLKSAGVGNAQIIIVTLNDPASTEMVVSSLRKTYPEKTIYARGHSLSQCRELCELGASGVVSENIEASLELARMALADTGVSEGRRREIVEGFRQSYHDQINSEHPSNK